MHPEICNATLQRLHAINHCLFKPTISTSLQLVDKILKKLCRGASGKTFLELHVPSSPKFVQKLVDYIAEEDKIKANHEVEQMKLNSSRYTIKRFKRRFLSSARGVKGTRSLEWGKTS
ncbi:MAG: hypothetical protein EZS28_013169 [Streblomastix strix]|uniref:Uncharacterized protein n=1 Tax=Streblomastix strix TaxID=222440 RepID=A0A5J4W9G7_9EUKA|nr:MAG: hypothetical protein EZS28_013169 [Streblomastix strix]